MAATKRKNNSDSHGTAAKRARAEGGRPVARSDEESDSEEEGGGAGALSDGSRNVVDIDDDDSEMEEVERSDPKLELGTSSLWL